MGLRAVCSQGGRGLSKGTFYGLQRILRGAHPLGNNKGTLSNPLPLHTHDFTPPPPLVVVPVVAPVVFPVDVEHVHDLPLELQPDCAISPDFGVEYQDALEQDEEVDLWADFGGSDP